MQVDLITEDPMTTENHRLRFQAWLVESGLDSETADAILRTMPPFDWHELATKSDLQGVERAVTDGFATIHQDLRSDREAFRSDMAAFRGELATMRSEMATMRRDSGSELATMREDMRNELAAIRQDLNTRLGVTHTEMATMRKEMATIRREGLIILLAVLGFILATVGVNVFG